MKYNRCPAALLALILCLTMYFCPSLSEMAAAPDYDEVFVIVHTNDVHGFIDVEPYVKAVADDMKAEYGDGNVITVSAGDVFSGGNAVAHLYNGETIPPIMDAAGYDILVPGNNDIFSGVDQLLTLAGMFEHTTMLCANLYGQMTDENGNAAVNEDGTAIPGDSVFTRTMTVETEGGVKIGLFGLTVAGLPFDGFVALGTVDGAREAVDILKKESCGVIIGIGHTGWNDDLVTPSANDVTSAEAVKEVPGIDVYIDGHSHSIINGGNGWICPETGTLVNQASCKGACIGVIRLYIKDGAVVNKTAELFTDEYMEAHYTPDPAVKTLVDAAWARLDGDSGEAYTETPYFLNALRASESADGRSIRTNETNLGDLVADFMRSCANADVAFASGVMIRCSIEEGMIYTRNLYDVFAIGCNLCVHEITGEALLREMAASLADLPYESPAFCQISGASYGYLKGYGLSDDGAKIYTIIDPTVNGEPLDPGKTYRIATGFNIGESEESEPLLSTMKEAAMAMGEYLRSGNAVILPDEPVPDHRIVPMDEAPADAVTYNVIVETEQEQNADEQPREYTAEENTAENKATYPYIVRTESAVWYLSKDDIDLLGEDAFFEGLREILQYQDADFADARAALAGFIHEDTEPIEIRTDFCGKAGISEVGIVGAYYNPYSNFIKVFRNWEVAKAALLHEYVHYLTIHCTDTPVAHGLFAEGIAEYINAIACKNRMRRDFSRSWDEEEKNYFKMRGTWDMEEDCLDLRLYESDAAGGYAHGIALGTEYLTTMDVPTVRTPEIQQNPTAENISHEEAADILAYLVETYSRETVFSHLDMDPAEMEQVYGETFAEIYEKWMEWNSKYFNESGVILHN